jgi:hypothetical protein
VITRGHPPPAIDDPVQCGGVETGRGIAAGLVELAFECNQFCGGMLCQGGTDPWSGSSRSGACGRRHRTRMALNNVSVAPNVRGGES